MVPFVLRDETPPDDDVVVVRGGEMNPQALRRTAQRAFAEVGLYLVSVFATLDLDVVSLCRTEPDLSRYGRIRTSTFGEIRAGGFALIPTLHRPHFDLVLPDLSDGTLRRLGIPFHPAIANPGRPGVP